MKLIDFKQRFLDRQPQNQDGVSLIVTMVMMLVLAGLGLAAMRNSTLQERMANNLRDRNIALQAAELALRDAERDLGSLKADGTTFCPAGSTGCRPVGERPTAASDRPGYWAWSSALRPYWTPSCPNGQCYDNSTGTLPVWNETVADWSGTDATKKPTVAYGTYTGATALTVVPMQPRYIIEIFPASPDPYGLSTQRVTFRITARAVGQNPNTIVILQSVSSPN